MLKSIDVYLHTQLNIQIMMIEKIKAGIYKVTTKKGVLMVRGGVNYNPDSAFFAGGGFNVWNASSNNDCNDSNCWACGASSKKIALQYIAEYECQ